MGRLHELGHDKMRYPFGCCAQCGKAFTDELRNKHHITHCPYCGMKIDDFLSLVDGADKEDKKFDLFCDDCGRRMYTATADGKGGDWTAEYAGICTNGCGRELCHMRLLNEALKT